MRLLKLLETLRKRLVRLISREESKKYPKKKINNSKINNFY